MPRMVDLLYLTLAMFIGGKPGKGPSCAAQAFFFPFFLYFLM